MPVSFDLADHPLLSLSGGVLAAPVSEPGSGNPLSLEATVQTLAAVRAVRSGDLSGVRVLKLYGPGRNFCAGGNVAGFASADDRSAHVREIADELHELVDEIDALDIPVVAQASGWAAGAGLSLLLGADVVVGSPATRVLAAYAGIGFTPDGGMSYLLPRAIGPKAAATLLLTNEPLSGDRAHALGLITVLTEDDAVEARTDELCAALASGPREAYAGIKGLLRDSSTATLRAQLDAERDSIARMAGTPDGVEGVDAFVAKRRPSFGAG